MKKQQRPSTTSITIGAPPSTDPTQPFMDSRPFLGSDGQTYHRRCNIKLKEWRAYVQDEVSLLVQQQYFVALFLGLVHPDTLLLPWPLRLEHSVGVFDELTFEQYFAVRDSIFQDVVNPASPKALPSPTSETADAAA